MKAFVITLFNDKYSVESAERCIKSARQLDVDQDLHIEMVRAVTPDKIKDNTYSYPAEGETSTYEGMTLIGYKAKDVSKKIACSLSHMHLWNKCVEMDEPIMILEHDAIFTRRFRLGRLLRVMEDGDVVMINDPRGATRRGNLYHENIIRWDTGVNVIDGVNNPDENVPDGLAGNSAYIITPAAAKKAYELQSTIGIWPNDALLCKQLFPRKLKSYYPYITRVEQRKSTTTGY
jgi:GR25 family glycosyltransferase involved in LPS biosynthesis